MSPESALAPTLTPTLDPATTPSLAWSQDLALGHAAMDQTHMEFVELLAQAEVAEDAELIERLQALTTHTVDHFGREDQWMAATDFGPLHCHGMQHRVVLQTLDELLRQGREEGNLALIREILPDLGKWFAQHAQTMDAGLASHLERVGFDPATGQMRAPAAASVDGATQAGCGSASCG